MTVLLNAKIHTFSHKFEVQSPLSFQTNYLTGNMLKNQNSFSNKNNFFIPQINSDLEATSIPICHLKRQSDVLSGWVGKTIIAMTFCVTKWFQRRSHFKRKNIISKYKKLQRTYFCFPFHTVATWEVLVLDGFLNSAFVICPRKKASPSDFYSSQHVENARERNYVTRVYSFRNHIRTF